MIIDLDSDADGFADWLENALGTDPTDINSAPADDDQDGIADALRGLRGAKGDQGPEGAQGPEGPQGNVGPEGPIGNAGPAYDATIDTDLDGFSDWVELLAGTDPLVGGDVVDDDQDGIPDGLRGPEGPIGATGVQGPVGPAGRDGATPLTDLFVESIAYQGAAVDIPRADQTGIDVVLDVGVEGLIEPASFKVSLDLTHPDLSALKVVLIAPDATAYTLADGPTTGVGGADLQVTFPDDLAPLTDFEQGQDAVVGKQAQGTWILRLIDTDFGNAGADRKVNGFGIVFTRKAQAAWRLEGDLHVNGSVFAQNTCTLVAATQNGQALAGVVEMQCGDAAPIRLYAFSCGNGALDPGESCDDGNQVPLDGCDARCILE